VPRCPRPGHPREAEDDSDSLAAQASSAAPGRKEALRRGWKVTHFNRGKRAAEGVAGVETLIGDRKGQLRFPQRGTWDVVVDDTGYIPKFVKMVRGAAGAQRRLLPVISSISAYASFAQPNDEHSPTGKLSNPDTGR